MAQQFNSKNSRKFKKKILKNIWMYQEKLPGNSKSICSSSPMYIMVPPLDSSASSFKLSTTLRNEFKHSVSWSWEEIFWSDLQTIRFDTSIFSWTCSTFNGAKLKYTIYKICRKEKFTKIFCLKSINSFCFNLYLNISNLL